MPSKSLCAKCHVSILLRCRDRHVAQEESPDEHRDDRRTRGFRNRGHSPGGESQDFSEIVSATLRNVSLSVVRPVCPMLSCACSSIGMRIRDLCVVGCVDQVQLPVVIVAVPCGDCCG